MAESYTLSEKKLANILESNSRERHASLLFPPSYLVDLEILRKEIWFRNPLRRFIYNGKETEIDDDGIQLQLQINYAGSEKENNTWFEGAFYSVIDKFVDGRSGLYENNNQKKLLLVDKKNNKILGFDGNNFITGDEDDTDETASIKPPICYDNSFRVINDSLFEFRASSQPGIPLNDNENLIEGPFYHYLHIQNEKLVALPNERIFGCTKYVKMDDSYLDACFVINDKHTERMTAKLLQYMKNEIYASYKYRFKSDSWNKVFESNFDRYGNKLNDAVDDSLTTIDKYNINWINQKLKGQKDNALAAK